MSLTKHAIEHGCPVCGIAPGLPCLNTTGDPTTHVHADRVRDGRTTAWVVYTLPARVGRGQHLAISHKYMARAPGCPDGPHPTRDCGCRPFVTRAEAEDYCAEMDPSRA